jgi:hypothetical protein
MARSRQNPRRVATSAGFRINVFSLVGGINGDTESW